MEFYNFYSNNTSNFAEASSQAKDQFRKLTTKSSKASSRISSTTTRFVTATAFPPTVPTARTSATTTTLMPVSNLIPIFNSTISSHTDLSETIITSNHNTNTTTMPSTTAIPVVAHNVTIKNPTQSNGTTTNIILGVLSKLIQGTN